MLEEECRNGRIKYRVAEYIVVPSKMFFVILTYNFRRGRASLELKTKLEQRHLKIPGA